MLAKISFDLPFELLVPVDEELSPISFTYQGFLISIEAPSSSGKPYAKYQPECTTLNKKASNVVDVLNITIKADSFTREHDKEFDPPIKVINFAISSFLKRLKFITKSSQIKPLVFPNRTYSCQFTNDNGSRFDPGPGTYTLFGGTSFNINYVPCDQRIWSHISALPFDFEPPPWHTLLIDARGSLPHVGTAVVLAATSLEVFIEDLLQKLAKESNIPNSLWAWINDRNDWQKEPSVEEKFSILLKLFVGHSLKEDSKLWEIFCNLRTARNKFVHLGTPLIGNTPVDETQASKLIEGASRVTSTIREWTPEHLRWPEYQLPTTMGIYTKIGALSESQFPMMQS